MSYEHLGASARANQTHTDPIRNSPFRLHIELHCELSIRVTHDSCTVTFRGLQYWFLASQFLSFISTQPPLYLCCSDNKTTKKSNDVYLICHTRWSSTLWIITPVSTIIHGPINTPVITVQMPVLYFNKFLFIIIIYITEWRGKTKSNQLPYKKIRG